MKDNIKGLYFKLNMENPYDKEIYQFFMSEPEKEKCNKIDLLSNMVRIYGSSFGGRKNDCP